MNIKNTVLTGTRAVLTMNGTGNSDAITIPRWSENTTVYLSSVVDNNTTVVGAKVQFSLSTRSAVKENTALWHDWKIGLVTTEGGVGIDAPTNYIRVVCASNVTYTIEVLA